MAFFAWIMVMHLLTLLFCSVLRHLVILGLKPNESCGIYLLHSVSKSILWTSHPEYFFTFAIYQNYWALFCSYMVSSGHCSKTNSAATVCEAGLKKSPHFWAQAETHLLFKRHEKISRFLDMYKHNAHFQWGGQTNIRTQLRTTGGQHWEKSAACKQEY